MFLGRFFRTSLHKVLIGQSTISTTTEQYYSVYFKHSGRNILENIGKTFHTEMVMSDAKKSISLLFSNRNTMINFIFSL